MERGRSKDESADIRGKTKKGFTALSNPLQFAASERKKGKLC